MKQFAIPDLWPADVVDVGTISPIAILRHQAGLLRQHTKNMLEAIVELDEIRRENPHATTAGFVIVARELKRSRLRLFTATFGQDYSYPVSISGCALTNSVANSQSELIAILSQVLSSPDTKSAIQSLIAQINDTRLATAATLQDPAHA